jgi:hypothetical protein
VLSPAIEVVDRTEFMEAGVSMKKVAATFVMAVAIAAAIVGNASADVRPAVFAESIVPAGDVGWD